MFSIIINIVYKSISHDVRRKYNSKQYPINEDKSDARRKVVIDRRILLGHFIIRTIFF